MRQEVDIEKVKRLFYDESNGFGSITLKNAHDKFADAVAGLVLTTGRTADDMDEEDISNYQRVTEMLEDLTVDFAKARGIKRFYLAAQKAGLIDDLSDFNLDQPEDETDMDAYGADVFEYARALAQHIYRQIEEKTDKARSGIEIS